MLVFRQECDEEPVGQAGGQTVYLLYFFPHISCQDSYSYYVTFVWSCNVALWDISLYLVEWGTCADIRLSGRHGLDMRSWLIHSYGFSSPIVIRLWYYLLRRISIRAKFHPSPPPRNSHSVWGRELAQDLHIKTAVWMGLVWCHGELIFN